MKVDVTFEKLQSLRILKQKTYITQNNRIMTKKKNSLNQSDVTVLVSIDIET